ncbi:hypothetical protein, partial [Escherichia coli]|uniref:hypothetical protein n=1 Tax=Escherichia coli TaxID=562 RepID=UPI001AD8BB8E
IDIIIENKEVHIKCCKEAGKFRLKEGSFSSPFVQQQMAKEQLAWKWWMMNGAECCPNLRPIAIKILAYCASNSSSKRNSSTYKYIHSTIRNR